MTLIQQLRTILPETQDTHPEPDPGLKNDYATYKLVKESLTERKDRAKAGLMLLIAGRKAP